MGIGAFGNKAFEVNMKRIYTFDELNASESLSIEQQETEGGKPATYIKGKGAMSISFNIMLINGYCDVESEINWWFSKMRSETPEYLTLGNKTFGTNKMLLNSVSVNAVTISPTGVYLKAMLGLSFSEWTKVGYKKEDSSSGSGSGAGNGSGEYSGSGADNGRQMEAGPSNKMVQNGTLKKDYTVGSVSYYEKNVVTVNGVSYFYNKIDYEYYPTSYVKTKKIDGGRTTAKYFLKGTPVYRVAHVPTTT